MTPFIKNKTIEKLLKTTMKKMPTVGYVFFQNFKTQTKTTVCSWGIGMSTQG